MSEENKALIMMIFDEALNGGNLDLIDEYFTEGEAIDDPPPSAWNVRRGQSKGEGREAGKQELRDLRASFPDIHWEVNDQIAEGDMVVNRFTITGTHTGAPFMGVPPSGKRFEMKGLGIDRVVDGIVRQGWDVADWYGLLQQLGAAPGGDDDG